jgi:hypothetical protein
MTEERTHRDRYDISGNAEAEYVDQAEAVLVNKLGVTDLESLQIAEEEGLARAYESLLLELRTDTLLSCDLLRHIHGQIFGEIYEWAGHWRTVNISKAGITWPPAMFVAQAMQEFETKVLSKYPAAALIQDEAFLRGYGRDPRGVPGRASVSRRQRKDDQAGVQLTCCTNKSAFAVVRPKRTWSSALHLCGWAGIQEELFCLASDHSGSARRGTAE